MGLLDRKEKKSRKKWLAPIAFFGAIAAVVGIKKKRGSTGAGSTGAGSTDAG